MSATALQQADVLARGAQALRVSLDTSQRDALLGYLALLERWNRAYNLTAVRDPLQMVVRHVLDSLSITELVHGQRLLDVGSGAGAPGLVLAVALPQLQVTLLDPSLKRTRFLSYVVQSLGLRNTSIERARLEDHRPQRPFDTVTSRAALALGRLATAVPGLVSPEGRLVAMLGRAPSGPELDCAPAGWQFELRALRVPGIDGERHAAILSRLTA